ncbi:hypothetical protein AAIH25_15165 [Arthrobacter crystallopoietes]|uniref:hypothetical protein n=1 Tax=Crystallibacter crystallopoietes TaxID=37928 RepID=UPI003D1DDDAA
MREQWAAFAWMYEEEEHTRLSNEFCLKQRADALENLALNMAFFAQLQPDPFEEALAEMLRKHKRMRQVTDLQTLDDEGFYVMVLNGSRQPYIGQTFDVSGQWSPRPRKSLIPGRMLRAPDRPLI